MEVDLGNDFGRLWLGRNGFRAMWRRYGSLYSPYWEDHELEELRSELGVPPSARIAGGFCLEEARTTGSSSGESFECAPHSEDEYLRELNWLVKDESERYKQGPCGHRPLPVTDLDVLDRLAVRRTEAQKVRGEAEVDGVLSGMYGPYGCSVKALSFAQPYAWAVLEPAVGQRISNLNWKPPGHMVGCRFLIHVPTSARTLPWYEMAAKHIAGAVGCELNVPPLSLLPMGGIVGAAKLVGWAHRNPKTGEASWQLPSSRRVSEILGSPWFTGPFGLLLDDVCSLPFTPLKAGQRFFKVDPGVVAQLGLEARERSRILGRAPVPSTQPLHGDTCCERR